MFIFVLSNQYYTYVILYYFIYSLRGKVFIPKVHLRMLNYLCIRNILTVRLFLQFCNIGRVFIFKAIKMF